MADQLVRAQAAPAAGEWVALLQAAGPTIISTFRACAISDGVTDEFDARIAYAGDTESDEQLLCRGIPVWPGRPYSATEGWTMVADDALFVRSSRGLVAFNVFAVQKG